MKARNAMLYAITRRKMLPFAALEPDGGGGDREVLRRDHLAQYTARGVRAASSVGDR